MQYFKDYDIDNPFDINEEIHVIQNGKIRLNYAPMKGSVTIRALSGSSTFTEVNSSKTAPRANEFRIEYGDETHYKTATQWVYFSESDNSKEVSVSYKGVSTLILAKDLNEMREAMLIQDSSLDSLIRLKETEDIPIVENFAEPMLTDMTSVVVTNISGNTLTVTSLEGLSVGKHYSAVEGTNREEVVVIAISSKDRTVKVDKILNGFTNPMLLRTTVVIRDGIAVAGKTAKVEWKPNLSFSPTEEIVYTPAKKTVVSLDNIKENDDGSFEPLPFAHIKALALRYSPSAFIPVVELDTDQPMAYDSRLSGYAFNVLHPMFLIDGDNHRVGGGDTVFTFNKIFHEHDNLIDVEPVYMKNVQLEPDNTETNTVMFSRVKQKGYTPFPLFVDSDGKTRNIQIWGSTDKDAALPEGYSPISFKELALFAWFNYVPANMFVAFDNATTSGTGSIFGKNFNNTIFFTPDGQYTVGVQHESKYCVPFSGLKNSVVNEEYNYANGSYYKHAIYESALNDFAGNASNRYTVFGGFVFSNSVQGSQKNPYGYGYKKSGVYAKGVKFL